MINTSMSNPKLPELNSIEREYFKDFEACFNDYCIQTDYRDLVKDPTTAPADHYKKPQLEIASLHCLW